jgi:hypothetical protein
LTKSSTALELENALSDYLGDHLAFAEKGKTLCLAEIMSEEEWARLLFDEKNSFLQTILSKHKAKEKKSYMPLKLKAAELKEFGLTAKSTVPMIEKAVTQYLGSELKLIKKEPKTKTGKETLYLACHLPQEDYLTEALQTQSPKKTFSLTTIAGDVPINKANFVALFNQMLETGQLHVKINDKFAIAGVKFASASAPTVFPATPSRDDFQLFKAAFGKLDCGRIYVRICNMRRELGWSVERFNTLLRRLRADGTIQLHPGDVSTLTEEDVNLSYTDENNFLYATLTWKKP